MTLSHRLATSSVRPMARALFVAGMLAFPIAPSPTAGARPDGPQTVAIAQTSPNIAKPGTDTPHATKAPASEAPKALRKVRVCQPSVREFSETAEVVGTLEAMHRVELKGRVSGRLVSVRCRPGQRVKEGDLLFEVDPRQYQAELQKAEAEVRKAQSRIKALQFNLPAIRQMDQKGVGGVSEAAEADLQTAKADCDLARLKLESTRVTSPIAGQVSGSILGAGNVVVADTTVLTTILSFDPIYVSFHFGEFGIMHLKRLIRDGKIKGDLTSGYPVLVNVGEDGGFNYPARMDLGDIVANSPYPNFPQVRLRAVLPNHDGFLIPGLSVKVKLVTNTPKPATALPVQDVEFRGNQILAERDFWTTNILVVNASNVIEEREARFEEKIRDGWYIIDAGLKAADWVVIDEFDPTLVGAKVEPVKVPIPK
jgi:RND family efflux transporter MFP subunit